MGDLKHMWSFLIGLRRSILTLPIITEKTTFLQVNISQCTNKVAKVVGRIYMMTKFLRKDVLDVKQEQILIVFNILIHFELYILTDFIINLQYT